MQNNAVTALIKMNTFAVLLCSALLVLGNAGLNSSLPIFVMGQFDFIHAGFFLVFNGMFFITLGCLLYGRKKAVNTVKQLATA
ncbi:phenylalanyl-tRNA synthetase subunit alpha [Photobacterium japonica]|uniref:phenylalanyl-tRNA synthetase subunit alpha n=1 Tax=Photobacterium japonica TaxID=2910235 RepID=UPI003D146946